ncbi:DUF2807 domain-containing protein [Marinilongibacter aquaticus]|uniref:head GIN domain-containing protein n=1 Tax=Marinilongibacter aquaticus TaxID=2975157 RepID=UPI0021BD274D|nr:head GIN domain-containing protein [Marinilongibacter aquaticus]UBM60289.1 DUF2807 domain-containing protein [Marinilongibacter aquaticus]
MKKLLTLIFFAVSLSSCIYTEFGGDVAPGELTEKQFVLDFFDEVEVGSAMHVQIYPSDEFHLTASGASRDIDDLKVRIQNGKLRVYYGRDNLFGHQSRKRMELYIEMPEIKELDASGATEIQISGFPLASSFDAEISGASQLDLNMEVKELELDLSGASDVFLSKTCQIVRAEISGASHLRAFEAYADKAYLELSGASKAYISVDDFLKVDASGASSVRYKGDPDVEKDLSGGSSVRQD